MTLLKEAKEDANEQKDILYLCSKGIKMLKYAYYPQTSMNLTNSFEISPEKKME